MGRTGSVFALVLVAAAANADEVYLRSGGHLSGAIVSRTDTTLEIEVSAGRVTIPHRMIDRIVEGQSALESYQRRARALSPNDVTGWLELAEWARSADLSGQARDAYLHVIQIDPSNAAAHAALNHRLVENQWMSHDEAMQAQGFVRFEGEWVQPGYRDTVLAERAGALRQRADAERAQIELAEAQARMREAEARAHAAEADARRAEEESARAAFVVVGTEFWGAPVIGPFVVGANPRCPRRPIDVPNGGNHGGGRTRPPGRRPTTDDERHRTPPAGIGTH
jgi:hypothetical protein